MRNKYPLPKISEICIEGYDLYKCPMHIDFSKKLNIVLGTNGLGKTSLLTMIQYSVIGPYCGALKTRNYGGKQKKRRPMYEKGFFKNRMTQINKDAHVFAKFVINNDCYEVYHSLYEHKLLKVVLNEEEIAGDIVGYDTYESAYFSNKNKIVSKYLIYNYHQSLMKSTGLPDENSLITMMNEIMFFTEDRDYIFWNEDTSKLLIAKYFMDAEQYGKYEEAQQLVKMFDSQARLKSYEMSFIKKFLGDELPENKIIDKDEAMRKLSELQSEITKKQDKLRKINIQYNEIDKKRIENRVQYEQCVKSISELDNLWYKNIFPDQYNESYKRYASSINMRKCPFCGSHGRVEAKRVDECFFCGEVIQTKDKVDLKEINIEKKNKEIERNILESNFEVLKTEIYTLKKKRNEIEKELNVMLKDEIEIRTDLDKDNNENYKKYIAMEFEKKELLKKLDDAKEKEKKMRIEIDERIEEVFQEYFKIFKKYASSFFGQKQKVNLKLVGNKEDRLFKVELNGRERETYYDMSESQRIFVDLSYRLSVLDYFHTNSYFICETPDSSLDLLFEDNAVRTFSNYIDTGNSLILSANMRNSKLITALLERYKGDVSIVNLLEKSNLGNNISIEELKQLEILKYL